MARKYTRIIVHEETILRMREEGKTKREIGNVLGLSYEQIKSFLKQHNRRQRAGIIEPARRGRPRKTPKTPESRIAELEREVALLRSFLHAAVTLRSYQSPKAPEGTSFWKVKLFGNISYETLIQKQFSSKKPKVHIVLGLD